VEEPLKRLASRAPGLDIFGQGLVIPEPAVGALLRPAGRFGALEARLPSPRIWASCGAGVFSMDRPRLPFQVVGHDAGETSPIVIGSEP
jgi:hypothetical protein